MNNNDYGKDLASVQNLIKKHYLIEADIKSHEDQINDLNQTTQQFTQQKGEKSPRLTIATTESCKNRTISINSFEILTTRRLGSKKLLVKSEDYGRDLNSVQNFKKKHKRLENELQAHEPIISKILEKASKYRDDDSNGGERLNNPNLSEILAETKNTII